MSRGNGVLLSDSSLRLLADFKHRAQMFATWDGALLKPPSHCATILRRLGGECLQTLARLYAKALEA